MEPVLERLQSVERDLAALAQRVAVLERDRAPAARPNRWPVALPPAPAPRVDWEALVGGRLLGLAGGGAVLIGIGLLVALAADRGLLGEGARVALALAGSLALLAGGVWLHEGRGRTQASMAAAGTGIAGLYLTLTAATTLYSLVSAPVALTLALVIGALATIIAVRWEATAVAGLGILGALAAPVLVSAPARPGTLAFLLVAHAAAVAVLVWRGWDWLGVGAFGVVMPQVSAWAVDAPAMRLVAVLALFGVLNLTGALGFAVRVRGTALASASVLLAVANAVVIGWLGVEVLDGDAGGRWLAVLAIAHGALGLAALGRIGLYREVARLLCALGLLLGDAAFALLAEGPVLPVGWAASAVLLAEVGRGQDAALARAGVVLQLGLASSHALLVDAPPTALLDGVADLRAAALALAVTAAAAWRCRRLADLTVALGAIAAGFAVYLASVAIVTLVGGQHAQVLVSSVWSVCGVTALWVGLRRDEGTLRRGGFVLLALATAKVALYDLGELDQAYRSVSTIALGLLLLAGAYVYQRLRSTAG